MPSNFAEVGKHLQTAIPVPVLPGASIRNRLRDANARHRSRVLIVSVLAAIAVLGSGTVLAAITFGGVRIWLSGDTAAVAMNSFAFVENPSAADLRRVASDATFPVVLPVGIPKGMHMNLLFFSPVDHPNFIEVRYRNAETDARSGQFLLFDSSTVSHGGGPALPSGERLPVGHVTQWNVGQETVIVPGAAQRAEIKAAMSRLTPAESLTRTLPRLYRITVLADQDRLADAAEVIAPSEGRSVLVDRGHLGEIAGLAQSHKPLTFARGTMFYALPIVNGKPDFAHQKSRRITETALSAAGVRAIAAVLASHPCAGCEVLINERSGRAYWIWLLQPDLSAPPIKYVVDSTTLHVVQGR